MKNDFYKPCPFCGYTGIYVSKYDSVINAYFVKCTYCGARTSIYCSEEQAKNAWNRRSYKMKFTKGELKLIRKVFNDLYTTDKNKTIANIFNKCDVILKK